MINTAKEEMEIEKSNGNTLWLEFIDQEMKSVSIYFELYEGNTEKFLPGIKK